MTKFLNGLDKIFVNGFVSFLVFSAIIILVGIIAIKIINRGISRKSNTVYSKFISRCINIAIILIIVSAIIMQITALKNFAVTLLAGSGLAALFLGFAAQEAFSNIVCGIMIIFSKSLQLGDFINIPSENISGTVKDLTLRHTVLVDGNNVSIIVPNSIINNSIIENTNLADTRVVSFLDVNVGYDCDLKKAFNVLAEIVSSHEKFLDIRTEEEKQNGAPEVVVRVQEFLDNAIKLRAFVWTNTQQEKYAILSSLRFTLKERFDEAGIEIPLAQRVIINKI